MSVRLWAPEGGPIGDLGGGDPTWPLQTGVAGAARPSLPVVAAWAGPSPRATRKRAPDDKGSAILGVIDDDDRAEAM